MALAALMGASAGLSLLSAASQYGQGQYANEAARREAEAQQQQAQFVQQQAGQQIVQNDWKASHLLSTVVTGTAAKGISDEGSPAINFASSAEEARISDMYTKYAANVSSQQLIEQSELTKAQGKEEESAANIGAITTAVGGPISSGIEAYGIGTKSGALPYGMSSYSDQLQLGTF